MSALFRIPYQLNPSLKEQSYSIQSLIQLLHKATVLMHGNLFRVIVQMVFLRLKVLILICHIVQWHMLTNSESTLLSRI